MAPLRCSPNLVCAAGPLSPWIRCATTGGAPVGILALLLLCCKPASFVRVGDEADVENTHLPFSEANDAATIGGAVAGASSVSHSAIDADSIRTEMELNEAARTVASAREGGRASFNGGVEAGAGSTIHGTAQIGDTSKTMGAFIATGTATINEGAEVGTGSVNREAAHMGKREGAYVGDGDKASHNFAGASKHPGESGAVHVLEIPPDNKCPTSGPHAHIGCQFPGCTCKWNRSCDTKVAFGKCVVSTWFWILVGLMSLGVMGVVAFGVTYIERKWANLN